MFRFSYSYSYIRNQTKAAETERWRWLTCLVTTKGIFINPQFLCSKEIVIDTPITFTFVVHFNLDATRGISSIRILLPSSLVHLWATLLLIPHGEFTVSKHSYFDFSLCGSHLGALHCVTPDQSGLIFCTHHLFYCFSLGY